MVTLKPTQFPNVFFINKGICTPNSSPGTQTYGETIYDLDNIEYRSWDPRRSKLAALILNGCNNLPILPNSNVLYLGAANGTTASHIADIATEGKIFCVEFSPRSSRDLLKVANTRNNIYPILENAFHPERYGSLIDKPDVLYQDLSQRDQVRAFIINAQAFLPPGGHGIFMIKSRSIDITKAPAEIFKIVTKQLKTQGFKVLEQIDLKPYTKDHLGLILRYEGF